MEEHRRTRFSDRGLIISDGGGDREVPLWAGAMHYWRVAPASWTPCLSAMRDLGLSIVQTYVPWSVHEDGPGRFEWDRELDLGRFLDRVADLGMLAILRPGPHINAELTGFGFPDRILRDPAMQARTARDTPVWLPVPPRAFPVPSYASRAFREQVGQWLRAVAQVVAPRLWPNGPVVALQVDNEHQLFFRVGAFDHDYHPDALDWWRDYAGDLEAPRQWAPGDADRCARWVAFKDVYAARALGWLAGELDATGLGEVARFHNLPPTEPVHADLPAIQRAVDGPCGIDFYHRAGDYPAYRRRALYLAGSAEPLAMSPEVGIGGPPWLPPMAPDDQASVILGLLACGLRGASFYMTVDRERWYGAAIGPAGDPEEPQHGFLTRLLAALDEVGWHRLRRDVPLAVMLGRAETRHATASSVADPVSPVLAEFLGLGPAGAAELGRDVSAIDSRLWLTAIERALALGQVPYELVDEGVSVDRLARYRAVVAPTVTRIDGDAWRRLGEAEQRGVKVIIGPGRPSVDGFGGDLDGGPAKPGMIRPESAGDLDGLAADLTAVAGDLDDLWIAAEGSEVDVSLYRDDGGAPVVLFAGNRTPVAGEAEILVPYGAAADDVISGDSFAEAGGALRLPLAAWQVRMLRVTDAGEE